MRLDRSVSHTRPAVRSAAAPAAPIPPPLPPPSPCRRSCPFRRRSRPILPPLPPPPSCRRSRPIPLPLPPPLPPSRRCSPRPHPTAPAPQLPAAPVGPVLQLPLPPPRSSPPPSLPAWPIPIPAPPPRGSAPRRRPLPLLRHRTPLPLATASISPQSWQPPSGILMTNDTIDNSSEEAVHCFALSKNDSYVMSASGGKISVFNMMTFKICVWNTDGWERQRSRFLQIPSGRPTSNILDTRVQFHQDQQHCLVVHETSF